MNIREIKNITTLEELVKYDGVLKQVCIDGLKIKSIEEIEDVVQDSYIKAYKYMQKGIVINAGYIFLIMKSIYINRAKKLDKFYLENVFKDEIDIEYDEVYYQKLDEKLNELDERLRSYLTEEEIALFKFYKLNTLKTTAKFYSVKETVMKNSISKIYKKMRENGGII